MTTGFVFHELYLWHNTGNAAMLYPSSLTVQPGEHAENPETKRRMKNLLEVSGLTDHLVNLKPRPATDDELARFHTRAHIEKIRTLSNAGGGDASQLTPFGAGSFEIGKLAAGGAIVAIDAVLRGEVRNSYALIRPPGHHALADLGMGFCLFGNAPIAIQHGRAVHGLGRVAVIDWDVHHGNGTQAAFYDDPETLTISLHADNLFPANSGTLAERGTGRGMGYNLNVPLPPGCGDGAYIEAIRRVVLPALARFKPDLIVVACGFDASAADPLGRMMVTSDGYRKMTAQLMQAADDLCQGRIMMTHEGSYSATYVPYCGLAVLEQLSGVETGVVDPFLSHFAGYGQQGLQPHQTAAIDAAVALVADIHQSNINREKENKMTKMLPKAAAGRRSFLKGAAMLGGSAATLTGLASTATAQDATPIPIGCVAPLTGFVAADGIEFRNGLEMAAEEINARGGILGRPIELHFEDSESKGDDVVTQAAQRLVDRSEVHAIITGYNLENGAVLLDVAADSGIIAMHANTVVLHDETVKGNPERYWGGFQIDPPEIFYGTAFLNFVKNLVDTGQMTLANNKIAIITGRAPIPATSPMR